MSMRGLVCFKIRFSSGLVETLGSQAFRESAHEQIDLVGQLIEADAKHPFRLRH
jgi:hypothetical protein